MEIKVLQGNSYYKDVKEIRISLVELDGIQLRSSSRAVQIFFPFAHSLALSTHSYLLLVEQVFAFFTHFWIYGCGWQGCVIRTNAKL